MNSRDYYLGPQALGGEVTKTLPIKVPAGSGTKVVPSYLGAAKGSKISNPSANITNLVLSDSVRNEATMWQVIKKLVLNSPDLSHAVDTKIKSAISQNYIIYAKGPDGRVDVPGTEAAQALMMQFDLGTYDYTKFTKSYDLRSITSSLLLDSFRYGSMGLELVISKSRAPGYLKPFAARLISWGDDSPTSYPIYAGPDGDIPLNYPTIFYSVTTQDTENAYSDSPLQTAIQACLWDADFADDLRRAATKNLLQRMIVTINTDQYVKTLPIDIQTDKKKMAEHMTSTVSKLEDQLSKLDPEDSIVLFDIMEADTIADANRSEDRSIQVLQDLINGRMSSGAKILPAIIGRGDSSNAASTESMLFLKSVSSSQVEINKLISRAMTLAVRILGYDVFVEFALEEVNLRPGLELESFKAIRQATELQRLSLGIQGDEITCIKLTGMLPPAGYVPLCGTGFQNAAADVSGNQYSNTSVSADGKTDSTQAQKDTEKT